MTSEKVARCRDSGLDCDFEACELTEDDLLEHCLQHVQLGHGMDENPVELAERIIASSRQAVQREAARYTWRWKIA